MPVNRTPHIKYIWGRSWPGFEQCLERLLQSTYVFAEAFLSIATHIWSVRCDSILWKNGSQLWGLQHCLKPQASVTVWGKQRWPSRTNMPGKETGGGWKLVTIGTVTFRMFKGGEVFPVSRLCGPVSFTHTPPYIPTLWTHTKRQFSQVLK